MPKKFEITHKPRGQLRREGASQMYVTAHWRPGHEKCYQIFSGLHQNIFLRTLKIHFTFDIWSKNPSITMKSWLKVTKVDPKNTKNWPIYVFRNFSGRTWEAPLSVFQELEADSKVLYPHPLKTLYLALKTFCVTLQLLL